MDVDCLVNMVEYDLASNGGQGRIALQICLLLASYADFDTRRIVFAVNVNACTAFKEWLGESYADIIPVVSPDQVSPLLQSLRPKLIISPLLGMPPFDRSRYPAVPHIVTIPDTLLWDLPEALSSQEITRRSELYQQIRHASRLITYSEQARQSVIRHLKLTPNQVVAIPPGGRSRWDQPVDSAFIKEKLPRPFVFYPANGWPHKRHDLLMEIMLEVWRTQPQWTLVLAGWHPPNFITDLIERYACPPNRIVDLGFVPFSQVREVYLDADALLFVSRFECFGMPLLEAMENGCPVICAPYGAMPEVVGDAGLFVEGVDPCKWAETLLDVLPGCRSSLVAKGYERAQWFTWDRFRAEFTQILEEVGLHHRAGSVAIADTVSWPSNVINREMAFWATVYAQQHDQLVGKEAVIQELIQALELKKVEIPSPDPAPVEAQTTSQAAEEAVRPTEEAIQELPPPDEATESLTQQLALDVEEKEKFIQTITEQIEVKEVVIQTLAREVRRLQKQEQQNEQRKRPILQIIVPTRSPIRLEIPLLRKAAKRIKNLRTPKLGVFRQYAPVPLKFPPYYRLSRRQYTVLPSISIVTPSYNQADFLERTINSVLERGYPKLEYVIQDGGSTDGTERLLAQYEARLTHVESVRDNGQADAINRGFAHVTGEIMGFLNGDDLLLPGALHYIGHYFKEHPEVDVVYGHRIVIDAENHEIGRWILPPHDDAVLSWADYIPQETVFWRRQIWDKVGGYIDETFHFALDWELILRFRGAGARFVRLPRFLGAFRLHEHQKTSTRLKDLGQQEMFLLRERYLGRVVQQAEVEQQIRPYLRRHCFYHAQYRLGLVRY